MVDSIPSDRVPQPKFIVQQQDGIYLALNELDTPTDFLIFIDRVFTSGLRFSDLDYVVLQRHIYDLTADELGKQVQALKVAGKSGLVKLASSIIEFPADRQRHYRAPKVAGGDEYAEYIFEPVFIEHEAEEEGAEPELERIQLDMDEFVAAMWLKNVRFGIETNVVRPLLRVDGTERVTIARKREPTPGQDATVVELLNTLRRSNAPKLLADGRVDLHQFENRFPQVEKGTRLMQKIPRVMGKSGWNVAGNELEPEAPLDLDLDRLSGLGTKVHRTGEGEFLIAEAGGFLKIDTATQSISITDKIINTEGVSVRTTGNLALTGDEYEEHGVVQERANIEGRNMTFMADVHGNITSQGGRVVLKKNLVAGSVKSPNGEIAIQGKASQATIEAVDGDINLKYAENCLIIGARVTIEQAIFCDVVARDLTIGIVEGCALAAQKVQLGTCGVRRDVETAISMLVPDMSTFSAQIDSMQRQQEEASTSSKQKREEADAIKSQAEVKTYLLLNGKIASKELVMTAEQSANFQKLVTRVTPTLKRLKTLTDEMRASSANSDAIIKKIQDARREAARVSAGIACNIDAIAGDTVVRTLTQPPAQAGLEQLAPRELRSRLREASLDSKILFSGASGKFSWHLVRPDEVPEAE